MKHRRFATLGLLALGMLLCTAPPAAAQNAAMHGTVRDAASGTPVEGALVQALTAEGHAAASTQSDQDGTFQLNLTPGRYDLVVSAPAYQSYRAEQVPVQEGLTLALTVELSSGTVVLNPVVVSASRQQEKALDAPTHVEVIDQHQVAMRPTVTPLAHLRTVPGMDIASTGLIQGNLVTRGFNNVFSGALLVMTDNRYVSVPSLRVNVPYVRPIDIDVERMEVLLGPASALYGPNSANGVLHIITRSPFDDPGTTISLTGGERSSLGAAMRLAQAPTDRFAFKITGEYFRGDDWQYVDPEESANRTLALRTNQDTRVGLRDYGQETMRGEARLDFRLPGEAEASLALGAAQVGSAIELTGLGAAQVQDWRYSYAQATLQRGRLFAQAFVNTSDAGDSYLLRTGQDLVDRSRVYVAQAQHGVGLFSGRQQFTYGLDYQLTQPRTGGTILGRNEGAEIREFGAYLQSETSLLPQVDLIAAARWDTHNHLTDPVISPRAALVFRPGGLHNVRLTYNRAFETPTSNTLFLDLESSNLDPLPLSVRALGVPKEGLSFRRDCGGSLCMRSPFAPNLGYIPTDATRFWPLVVQLMRARGVELGGIPAPAAEEVGSVLRILNTTDRAFYDVSAAEVENVEPLRPTITNTFEAGYQGLIGRNLILSADVYHTRKEDFIGPLTVETPSVFLDPAELAAYLNRYLPAEQAAQVATAIGGLPGSSEFTGIPLGTVVPDDELTRTADLLISYRNFGEVSHWGSDMAAELLLPWNLSVRGTYSFVSQNFFTEEDLGGLSPVALNAPQHKGSLAGRYRAEDDGLTAELRARHVGAFPMNSGVYLGDVEAYTVVDAMLGFRLPFAEDATLGISVQNLLDDRHREFVGAPEIGRLMLTRLQYSF